MGSVLKVLDLCCAPGSKTSQLLDMMHRSAGRAVPTGVLVANDVDKTRVRVRRSPRLAAMWRRMRSALGSQWLEGSRNRVVAV